jgi:glucose-1-phosphate cytidylyltransferase
MKVVILAGGLGTRLTEETIVRPKPMVEIGGRPILWHIMKIYSHYGFNEFIICLGYKGYIIKEYFANYFRHQSDITIDIATQTTQIHTTSVEPWKVTLIDTGGETMTGGRVKRIKQYTDGKPFMLTYGDGVSDVNIGDLANFHQKERKLITVTAVQPIGRFGAMNLNKQGGVASFVEKPQGDGAWVNGGFFVCEQGVFDYIDGDKAVLEKAPFENLARAGQMAAFQHEGFWRPMDTLRDRQELDNLWDSGKAAWKKW